MNPYIIQLGHMMQWCYTHNVLAQFSPYLKDTRKWKYENIHTQILTFTEKPILTQIHSWTCFHTSYTHNNIYSLPLNHVYCHI